MVEVATAEATVVVMVEAAVLADRHATLAEATDICLGTALRAKNGTNLSFTFPISAPSRVRKTRLENLHHPVPLNMAIISVLILKEDC